MPFSNYKVTFIHDYFLVQMVNNHHPQGTNLRVVGHMRFVLPRTRNGHPRVPHTAHHKRGQATKKDAGYNAGVFQVAPCVLRGTNPGLIYIRHINCNLMSWLCQLSAKIWHNTALHLTAQSCAARASLCHFGQQVS